MIMLAKVALGFAGTIAVAGAYTFREGVMRIDVDEHRDGGTHVHLWLPAAAVPMLMDVVPRHHLQHAAEQAREWMPVARIATAELARLPDSTLVEVQDGREHVLISLQNGAIKIDVTDPEEAVHVLCPLATIGDVSSIIERAVDSGDPGA
jgi:hypothetical protein